MEGKGERKGRKKKRRENEKVQVCSGTPIIPAHRKQSQDHYKYEVSLRYIMSSRPA